MANPPRTASSATKARKSQLRIFTLKSAAIPSWFLLLHIAALILFGSGFLLSRPVLNDVAKRPDIYDDPSYALPRPFKRAVVILIDALREDFISGENAVDSSYFSNAFTTPVQLAVAKPENAAVFKFIADPPTTTLQRLKALTTGSLPTFVDAGSNFNGMEILEDSWIGQIIASHGENRIAFAGDDTWLSLFPSLSNGMNENINLSFPYESFNVWDLNTVDAGVTAHILPLLDRKDEWDVLIAHYLGVDHAGHRFGPDTPQMRSKLLEMDEVVKTVVEVLNGDDDTLLIVLGDHGMDSKGDHGGDSKGEVEAGLFLYSSRAFLAPSDAVATVNQIDLVPTLSILLGLPVPFNNLGSPIVPAIMGPEISYQKLASATRIVSDQLFKYRSSHPSFIDSEVITNLYVNATSLWQGSLDYERISELNLLFQKENLKQCREMWARFDVASMVMGITVLVLSTGAMGLFYAYLDETIERQLNSLIKKSFLGSILGLLLGFGIGHGLHRRFTVSIFGLAVGSILGFASKILLSRRQPTSPKASMCLWTCLGLVYILLHGFLFASNSYVVWESKAIGFLLTTFGFLLLAASCRVPNEKSRAAAIFNSVVFIILARAAQYPTICREEQLPFCTSNFYGSTASSVSSLTSTLLLFAVAAVFPAIVKSFLRTSASYEGSAGLWIGKGLRLVLALVGLYWFVDYVESEGLSHLEAEQIKMIKFVIARLVFGITVVGAPLAWLRGLPLCLRVEMTNNQDVIKRAVDDGDTNTASKTPQISVEVIGFGNTYGSLFMLILLSIFAAIELCMKPVGGIALAGMVYQLFTLLEVGDFLDLPALSPLIMPVIICLMAAQYYFATGHQATIPSIQWDIAFLLVDTIRAPLTHMTLIFNTFGPYILAGFAVPLTVFYKLAPSPREYHASEVIMIRILRASMGAMIYAAGIALLSCVTTLILRRHLMVWKIFAPRFMLAGTSLLVVDVAIVLATLVASRVITGVYEVFG